MNLKNLKTEQIKDYILSEREKGRSMREVVKEVVDARDDCTLLSYNPETALQQILAALS